MHACGCGEIGLALTVQQGRPVAKLSERGVHVKNMQASEYIMTQNLMHFKLSTLVLNILKFGWWLC